MCGYGDVIIQDKLVWSWGNVGWEDERFCPGISRYEIVLFARYEQWKESVCDMNINVTEA